MENTEGWFEVSNTLDRSVETRRESRSTHRGKNVSAGHLFGSQLCLLLTMLWPISLVVLEKYGIENETEG